VSSNKEKNFEDLGVWALVVDDHLHYCWSFFLIFKVDIKAIVIG
jgi:hypothetical protein